MQQRKCNKIWYLIIVALLLCGCGAHRVKEGVIRDTLFSVEQTKNGYWRIWMTHDDICGYCTYDDELGRQALDLLKEHDGDVLVYFRDIKSGDPEFSWWSKSDCGSISIGPESSTHIFMFYELSRVPPR